jgi:hypothetical protein
LDEGGRGRTAIRVACKEYARSERDKEVFADEEVFACRPSLVEKIRGAFASSPEQ